MEKTQDNLVALVGSRICHDLISPIGAISNGVELMSMAGSSGEQELALITESVENANARIRFFRVAFGVAHADQMLGGREIAGILSDLSKGSRFSINWQVGTDLPRAEARVAFLLLLCFETAMPFGGECTVTRDGESWKLEGTAPKMRQEDGHWVLITDPDGGHEISASIVHFALAPDVASRIDRQIRVERDPTWICLTF
ncbi:histidine phosphotransferase ChpT [Poseidonocella pacifica]|uniref:Histidine phosphotransferase ChpT n=1 Tax=Poseidonocella pacifica TaxID=871651 RepID=A0A1I0X3C3_9RHOB|nr:histidine phosphotransferase family protein [Poseidonocella pacifica]SFA95324.1 histidine phosphotransferase ChpT [Poseidonocella pacifica]